MSSADALRGLKDSVWLDQGKYEQAEARYQQVITSRRAEVAGKVLFKYQNDGSSVRFKYARVLRIGCWVLVVTCLTPLKPQ